LQLSELIGVLKRGEVGRRAKKRVGKGSRKKRLQ
jgi:hypothetical protein